jgi:phosphoesterase RecJ-like protein
VSLIAVVQAIRDRQSFVLTSHARPDGDAIGSQIALGLALESLGKTVRFIDHDPAPLPYRHFPAVDRIEVMSSFDGTADAVIVMECGSMARTEVGGLERLFSINIDHHAGNTMYGAVNWYDESAAAVAEMAADVIDALGVPWTPAIAMHLYLGISTDTGSFRHANITARTFELCRRIAETGVNPAALAREIYDSFSIGRVRLTGEMLHAMELHHDNQLAVLYFDDELLTSCGATVDDTDGLVNIPLGAKDVVAVALVKKQATGEFRVSLRSKGDVDVRAVAQLWGGGGHRNASGCTLTMAARDEAKAAIVSAVAAALLKGQRGKEAKRQ